MRGQVDFSKNAGAMVWKENRPVKKIIANIAVRRQTQKFAISLLTG
jgi:hypothetical protein